jgi:hypothetical protein
LPSKNLPFLGTLSCHFLKTKFFSKNKIEENLSMTIAEQREGKKPA